MGNLQTQNTHTLVWYSFDYNFQDNKLKHTKLICNDDSIYPTRRENRGMDRKIYNQDEWRTKVQRARSRSKKLGTREEPTKCE